MERSPLEKMRLAYRPSLPPQLRNLSQIQFQTEPTPSSKEKKRIDELFPKTANQPLLRGSLGTSSPSSPLRVGVFFSGGPAAGGHNVITGLFDALKQIHGESRLFGFLNGPQGVIDGSSREITLEELQNYRNQGGFDLIGSGRTKIETPEQMQATYETVEKLGLNGLVVIGGDDSNTIAAMLAEYFKKRGSELCVIGAPKTIDGDLQNPYVAISFGFDTACKTYAEVIGNIARDAASARKYTHFIKLMGRSASHVTLECALLTHPNLTLIGEEVKAKNLSLAQITSSIADMISKRCELGKNYGVVLVPEGLIEFIPEIGALIRELNALLAKDPNLVLETIKPQLTPQSLTAFTTLPDAIQKQLLLHRDPHGNVQVSLIETEKLLMEVVAVELDKRKKEGRFKGKYAFQHHFLGYEGRAGFPSNFDCNYCYALGHVAALLISRKHTGYMCFVEGLQDNVESWKIGAVPLTSLLYLEVRKGKEQMVVQKALVDLSAKPFLYFQQHRKAWELEDAYLFPGPIQYFGDPSLTETPPIIIQPLETT